MNRQQLESYIEEAYNANAEHPWAPESDHTVFRHRSNRKWFAVVMEIPKAKLGIGERGSMCIVNLKCDPLMVGSFLCEAGVFPAYHMNKTHWLSVAPNSGIDSDKLKLLIDISFELTAHNRKIRS